MSKLYETITAENWSKTANSGSGPTCVGLHARRLYSLVGYQAVSDAWDALLAAVTMLYPQRAWVEPILQSNIVQIGRFNDHPDTTLEDVLRVCKLADV